jgi:Domain of unknown function (DUF4386)
MESNRRLAVTAGLLFIAATAANLVATAIEQPALGGADYLGQISENVNRVAAGGLLELIAAGTSVSIAISLYPVLRKWSEGLGLGAVVFRAIEAGMYAVGAVGMLSLLNVSEQLKTAAPANRAWLMAIADSMFGLRQEAILAGVFAFAVGALMYYYVFFQAQIVPRWLSGWGIVAVLLLLVACLSALFTQNPVTSYTILILPIAVQEMVLAIWLIAKGFSSPPVQVAIRPEEVAA